MLESIIVLRHTDAGQKNAWTSTDAHRPLSITGLEQATQLINALQPYRFDQIWTSPFARCQHSIAPLAAHRRTPVIATPWLAPDSDPASIEHGLTTLHGHVLVCTHGECIQPILHTLTNGRESTNTIPKGHALAITLDHTSQITTINHIHPTTEPTPPIPEHQT